MSAVGSGARTLTLDAAEGTVNYLENVDEGDASLSLVKTGAGKWVLQGKAAVSGGLLVLFRKKIQSRFIKSFLFYVPYAVLGAMTFPAIIYSTSSIPASCAGLIVALLLIL